ncbi:hypothetical protein V1524DRAFT_431151 [Lipomyces starkeyi]
MGRLWIPVVLLASPSPYREPEKYDRGNAKFNYYISRVPLRTLQCSAQGRFQSLKELRILINDKRQSTTLIP